ncbi:aldehyde dehydrogenase family protein [Saccharothrix australiensis]|uniref:Acyl-CoA reductase-like NAD-dependent aldehyde dehydrogenase n=1 Tax=Saccharothrix australiensis TaxID=2072 RepID=A0A495W1D9_9PSEU|nr:aldehyde dehydrogenase family protein [Saccharothrix australiensis]RKT54940.1 acyl-CoA reductase-like NAD-dependent aldehyde dehydrogenase [Saccharothrix australiensis]
MTIHRDLLIAGDDVPAADGRTVDDVNPFTGEVFATVAAAGPKDVTRAVDAADAAFPDWAAVSPFARRKLLLDAADLLDQRAEQAVELMAGEAGGTARWARFNVFLAANILREAAASVTAPRGEVLAAQEEGALGLAVREPVGVVAAFAPWNAPLILGTRAFATPIAAGNTVVLKPSEDAPLASGLFLADVLRDAGLPAGVLNVVTNDPRDAAEVAETLIADPRVRVVNFTGSTEVGRIIGTHAARHLKPAVLELGGKNAIIVLDDADLDHAVNAAAFGVFMNSGQICMSGDRLLVHEKIADEFTARFVTKVASLPAGDPADPETVIGPLVNTRSAQRVAALVRDARDKGATVLTGGGEPDGALHPATVLTGVTPEMDLHYGEAFGPVCVLETFASDDEAVAKANDTEHGLTCGIITENGTRGLTVARRVRTGIVHVNDQSVGDEPQAPFGGVKSSGYGRFGGRWGVEAFTTTRWITLATTHAHYPF